MHQLYLCTNNQAQYHALLTAAELPQLALTEDIKQANIILADPPLIAPQLPQASSLVWLQSTFAGCDKLIAAPKQDYLLTNIRGCFGPLMSEYVFGQLINVTRNLSFYRQAQRDCQWQPQPYASLQGRTLAIIGTGSIGCHLAQTARYFGMRVIGVNRSARAVSGFEHIYPITELSTALAQAQVIVSVLPATQQTQQVFNQASFSACQQAIFFNVGRGSAVDEQALLAALENGNLRHAVLDVFAQEPLPAAHPFWHHPAITLTPHISASSLPSDIIAVFTKNYLKFINQQPLDYVVDFKVGY